MDYKVSFLCLVMVAFTLRCSQTPTRPVTELRRFPMDSLEGVLTQSGVEMDKATSSDGQGSIKFTATEPTTMRLFEAGDMDIENARLTYQAKLRTEGVEGQVYLEMWCHFPGKGEYFSRGLETPLT